MSGAAGSSRQETTPASGGTSGIRGEDLLSETPYQGYAYSYPHKAAWRPLEPPIRLADVWRDEPRGALFMYVHVPFCEARCGYCNLFSVSSRRTSRQSQWMEALAREALAVRAALGDASFARLAIGGGTPTILDDVDPLFDLLVSAFGVNGRCVPTSCETSPATARRPVLERLRDRGVDRVSIGIQSWSEDELRALGRARPVSEARTALEQIRWVGFPTLNVDLIYGISGQTAATWLASLRQSLAFEPDELYLYPLYVRPGTPLGRLRGAAEPDVRLDLYRVGRDFLCDRGYTQVSMRMFRRDRPAASEPIYRCQEDGMVGLGCGARSYTRRVHYAAPYATDPSAIRGILDAWLRGSPADSALARHGFILDDDEARRRYVIKSLLQVGGLDLEACRAWVGGDVFANLPCLETLLELDLATRASGRLRLTPAGLERSDAIGPWLYSERVRSLMASHGAS